MISFPMTFVSYWLAFCRVVIGLVFALSFTGKACNLLAFVLSWIRLNTYKKQENALFRRFLPIYRLFDCKYPAYRTNICKKFTGKCSTFFRLIHNLLAFEQTISQFQIVHDTWIRPVALLLLSGEAAVVMAIS